MALVEEITDDELELEVDEELGGGSVTAIKNILARIIAVFAASGLSVIGAGAVVGISTAKAVILAGTLGVATVVEKLARGFLDDGKLTSAEINAAFSSVDKRADKAE
jgi:hypothetical protein